MSKTGLVLEGGGTRGVFSAGVLDYFMEQNLYLPYVIGVSAGACNAVNYAAHQPGRTRKCTIDYLRTGSYMGMKHLIRKHSLFDMDLIFDVFPNSKIPFDYDAFFQSDTECVLTAVNCLTGQPVFISEKKNKIRLMSACRASSSLPLVSPMVYVDEIPMLDGGVGDSVPIRKALEDGCKKNVVILTRCSGYRKRVSGKTNKIARVVYQKYPNLVKAIYRRPGHYNKTMELIERLERKNRIFVIRPEIPVVGQTESNPESLYQFYMHGYSHAKQIFPKLLQYLGEDSKVVLNLKKEQDI